MAERPVGVTDEAAGAGVAEYRTRERSVGGSTVAEQYLIQEGLRVASYRGLASTFRTLGNATQNQYLLIVDNAAGSGLIVAVRRVTVQRDQTATQSAGAVMQVCSGLLGSTPTNGTVLTKVPFDSALTSSASVVIYGSTASDGGADTSLSFTPGTPLAWRQGLTRFGTAVGSRAEQQRYDDSPVVPSLAATDPPYLRPGEAFGILVTTPSGDNANTYNSVCNVAWEEFTLP